MPKRKNIKMSREKALELKPFLVEALRGNTHQRFAIIWNAENQSFVGDGDRTPALVQFMQLHQEQLVKELQEAIVTLHWNDWDQEALVTIVPAKSTDEPFRKYKLPFPPRKPSLVQ